jgi:hypothetical protein
MYTDPINQCSTKQTGHWKELEIRWTNNKEQAFALMVDRSKAFSLLVN